MSGVMQICCPLIKLEKTKGPDIQFNNKLLQNVPVKSLES